MNNKAPRPTLFRQIWNVFSTAGGVLGLASMVDSLDPELWQGFFDQLVQSYRSLVHPLFDFLFSWLPFAVPRPTIDYLVVGILYVSCFVRSEFRAEHGVFNFRGVDSWDRFGAVYALTLQVFLWPIVVPSVFLIWALIAWSVRKDIHNAYIEKLNREFIDPFRTTFSYFFSVLLLLLIVLIVNYALFIR